MKTRPKTYTIDQARNYLRQAINKNRVAELPVDVELVKPKWYFTGVVQSVAITVKVTDTTSMTKYMDLKDGLIDGIGFRVMVEYLTELVTEARGSKTL